MTRKTITIVLAALAVCVSYADVLRVIAKAWLTSEVYSYGLAVLAIAGYMIWTKKEQLRSLTPIPDYRLGVPTIVVGVALLVFGHIGLLTSVQEASVVVTLAGFALLLFGRAVFACIWFPLFYLLLGFPLWDAFIGWLQPPSQQISGRLAAVLLRAIDIPVLQDGTKFALPNVTLEVLRECSGVNQLLAVVAMALPAAYIWLRSPARRAALLLLSVIGAYASNGVRIALVGYLATNGLSNGDLRGLHLFEGLAISALCYLVILVCLSLLVRTERHAGQPSGDSAGSGIAQVRPHWSIQAALSMAVLCIGLAMQWFHTRDVRLSRDLWMFPARIGDWSLEARPSPARFPAIDDDLVRAYPSPSGERHFVALDDEMVRAYRDASGDRVRLYIGYHRSQREGKELAGEAGHALNAVATPLHLQVGSRTVELGEIAEERSIGSRGVLYWYDLNGRVVMNMYRAKQYMVWDTLTRGRSNGAVVMIAWESASARDAALSRTKATAFARSILPLLPNFIPS